MLQSPTSAAWQRTSPIELLISRACDPSLPEPNYALHLEVAEYINTKKANNPREAAMHIAHLANHRNPHISILALALLQTLTNSCGYPFHLQIATKEFLNELVRRFPERPPPFPGPVMGRILETIQGWKEGICLTSRWKEDLGNIRDMHRLLTFKGYRFRESRGGARDQVLQAASANLKSAAELESEDRDAQSAKLQELIRRGTPRDLAAAQELMKSLAGADPAAAPDYRGQAMSELHKLESKVVLLNEMLDNADIAGGERAVSGDVYEQVAIVLEAARGKVQGLIGEGGEDSEELDTFLQINDGINTVLARYDAFKRGDFEAAKNPIPRELAPGNAPVSLIDFDGDSSSSAPTGGAENDLDALFGGISLGTSPSPSANGSGNAYAASNPAGIALPGTPNPYQQQQQQQQQQAPPGYFAGAQTQAAPTPNYAHRPAGFAQQQLSTSRTTSPQQPRVGTPHSQSASPKPNYFALVAAGQTGPVRTINTIPTGSTGYGIGMGSSSPAMGNMGMARLQQQQQQQQQQRTRSPAGMFGGMLPQSQAQQPLQPQVAAAASPPPPPPTAAQAPPQSAAKDPFADLAGLF